MESKASKVNYFIRKAVDEAVKEIVYYSPDDAPALKRCMERLKVITAANATETYRFMELRDIMAWKKPKDVK